MPDSRAGGAAAACATALLLGGASAAWSQDDWDPVALALERVTRAEPDGAAALCRALDDLAREQLNSGDAPGAQATYRRSLAIAEESGGVASPLQIGPLAGLAAVAVGAGRHELAADLIRHAIAISRRAHGLFSGAQLPLLERLAASLEALGDRGGLLEVRQYVLTIAEQSFGRDDPRTLVPIRDLAALYGSLGRHGQARTLFARMRRIAQIEGEGSNVVLVEALLGTGRSHRREFVDSPMSMNRQWVRDPVSGTLIPEMSLEPYQTPRPRREGPKATASALELLRSVAAPPPRLLAEALVEMGDWRVVLDRAESALPYYAEAAALHSGPAFDGPDPLSAPRLVLYRAPPQSRRTAASLPGEISVQSARFRLTVDAAGRPARIMLLDTTANQRRTELLRRSLELARYSPRFAAGVPVATHGVEFEAHWEALADEPDGPAR